MDKKTNKYLPSKKFMLIAGIVLFIFVVVFTFLFISSKKQSFKNKKEQNLEVGSQTIASLLQTDTDRDSIPDWEEALWGTDKNNKSTFGVSDIDYIQKKKDELKIEQAENDKTLNETDKFAREFFATYSAMSSSGLDNETINNFSSALGEKVSNPDLPDVYTKDDLKTKENNSEQDRMLYYTDIQTLFDEYQENYGLGNELGMVGDGLISYSSNGESAQYQDLNKIGEAYKDFAYEASRVSVPSSLVDYHLRIVNNAHNTGLSVSNMTKVINDPVIGISGLSQYQKYSKDLENSVVSLENYLFEESAAANTDQSFNIEDYITDLGNGDTTYTGDLNQ